MDLSKPETWQTAKLSELAIYVLGGDWGKDADFESPDYADALCIRGAEFRNWNEDKGATASLRKIKKSSLVNRVLQNGDILVEISGGGPEQPVGRTVLIDKAALSHAPELPKICTNFVRLLRTTDGIDSRFLNSFLSFFYASGEIRDFQAGSNNLRNLKFNDYLEIDIPLPPFNEQHRIVAKIEELFSELDKGIENLKTAREQLKVYRQALLKHAFEGKLTAQWREQNRDKLEIAAALLARIQTEREQRYQQQLQQWQISGGNKPKAPKPLPPLTAEELAELPELPDGWAWASFDSLFDALSDGGIKIKQEDYLDSGILPVIDQGERFIGGYASDENKKWDGPLPVLLFGDHTRRFKLIDFPFAVGADGVKVIGLPAACNAAYCYHISVTRRFEDRGYSRHFQFLRKAFFPICSRLEQDEIVSQLEFRFSAIDQLELTLTASLQQAEALRQSILKRAFSGQLVQQNPNDEPAAALLARIQAERASVSAKPAKMARGK